MKTAMTSIENLAEIVNRLVRGLHPERVYLFGSRARGEEDEHSDYDLLVVVPESDLPRHRREAQSYDLLWGVQTPVDIIVLTRQEFERSARVKTSLSALVQKEGVILYGAG
ncbi:MAG: nucleotidyltransferase domain-containing protein [Chloroflexi bacterium]|nr:nucleotidyltransferase domain-containing protein [Chloroflexota bacterium]